MEKEVTIIIADDHPIFRKGLRDVILEEKKFSIIGEASTGKEALEIITAKKPDIVIMDLEMPQLKGLEVLNQLNQSAVSTKVIFLTMYNDEEFLYKAMDYGAAGYILKDSVLDEVKRAITNVLGGNYYVSPPMTKYLVERKKRKEILSKEIPGINLLTPVEKKILSFIAEHKTSKEIAVLLSISHRTVEKHRNNISKKLNLSGGHALLKFALEYQKFI